MCTVLEEAGMELELHHRITIDGMILFYLCFAFDLLSVLNGITLWNTLQVIHNQTTSYKC